jgi:hypothetical protein
MTAVPQYPASGFFDVTLPLPPSPLLSSLGLNVACFDPQNLPQTLQAYGDGATDDTLAIQNAIYWAWTFPSNPPGQPAPGGRTGGTVYFPPGTYVCGGPNSQCNTHLYVPGNVNLIGANAGGDIPPQAVIGELQPQPGPVISCPNPGCLNQNSADAVLRLSTLPVPFDPVKGPTFWISLGWAGPNDIVYWNNGQRYTNPCSIWTGRISGLRFTIDPAAARFQDTPPDWQVGLKSGTYVASEINGPYILFLHHCQGFAIEGNYFDLQEYGTRAPSPVAISGTESSDYAPPNPVIANGIIRRNVINAAMGYYGGAGITVAGARPDDPASNIVIEENYVSGVGDEVIGIHQVNNAVIRNNFCSGIKAGIWLLHCQHFIIEGNYAERGPAAPMPAFGLTTPTWWQGSLMFCGIEDASPSPPCTDGRIVNNAFVISPPAGTPPPGTAPGTPAPPAAPGLAAVAGPPGTNQPAATYYVRITFAGPPPPAGYGESAPGPEASLAITNPADVLQVSFPATNPWASTVAYASGELVSYNNSYYASLPAANVGNVPDAAPGMWAPVTAYNVYVALAPGAEQLQGTAAAGAATWVAPHDGVVEGAPPPAGVHDFVQLGGLRRAIVAENLLRCDTPYVFRPAFRVEPYPPPGGVFGWVDTEGLDQDQIARPRDILIRGNRATGAAVNMDPALVGGTIDGVLRGDTGAQPAYQGPMGVFQMGEYQWPPSSPVNPSWIPGPLTWQGNEANSFHVFGGASSLSINNRVIGDSGDGMQDVDGYRVPDAMLLWSGTLIAQISHVAHAENGGGTRFYPLRQGIIFYVKATAATPIAAGNLVRIELVKTRRANAADDLIIDSTLPHSKRRQYGISQPGVNNRFIATDFFQIKGVLATIPPALPQAPLRVLVELYGMYTSNGSFPGA